jgi:diguanylate cyclase (GGDEF)-like protein
VLPGRRTTIGVLAGWQVYERTTPNWFLEAVLRGVAEAGRALDCDVLLSCGIDSRIDDPRLVRPAWPEVGEGEDFAPVGSWNTDGLLFVSPLRTAARRGYAQALQEQGFPVVFVGSGDGHPAVVSDSGDGFRQALEHLRAHGHRRVAFISGDPLDCGDSRTRLADFMRLRHELGLGGSENLIAPGLHSVQGGYEAMRAILAEGDAFTAVLASNDMSAVGAIRALEEAGRRVPQDVAVIGFDDQPAASAQVPPLATVRYPLADAGRRAAELLVDLIRHGRRPPDATAMPATLVVRRSCGCLHRLIEVEEPAAKEPRRSDVARLMATAVERAESALDAAAISSLCERLADGFEVSQREGSLAAFETALTDVLQRIEAGGDRAHRWHPALTRLRRALPPDLPAASRLAAEDLLEMGRVALSESADRQEPRRGLRDSIQADLVSALTVPLQSAQDASEILALLAEHAPALGVRPLCLALYEGGDDDPFAWSRVRFLAPGPGSEPAPPAHLETRRVLREHLPPSDEARCLMVLPLVRQGRSLGFLAVEAATLVGGAAIARQLAVALESVRLQGAVRALSVIDDLTGLHNRRFFEVELGREVERARRFDRDLALVLVDVDHFKDYNDSFGHRAGDDALRRVATCLAEAASRRLDAVTRYGGEEFAVLLAETDADGAQLVAERAREAVAASPGFRRPLTVSAGVASTRGAASEREDLVLRADAALYRAKHDGRNCVRVAP